MRRGEIAFFLSKEDEHSLIGRKDRYSLSPGEKGENHFYYIRLASKKGEDVRIILFLDDFSHLKQLQKTFNDSITSIIEEELEREKKEKENGTSAGELPQPNEG